ncbi:MAG: DUF87 domain-containing protein [Chloroflexota bacterium]|nr:DUF87 domain-containing protein [Chloroflexota bacterium]
MVDEIGIDERLADEEKTGVMARVRQYKPALMRSVAMSGVALSRARHYLPGKLGDSVADGIANEDASGNATDSPVGKEQRGAISRMSQYLPGKMGKGVADGAAPGVDDDEGTPEMRGWPSEDDLDSVPALRSFMGYSHVEGGERIVRDDGRRIAVFQVQGKEVEEKVIRSFAGALNSLNSGVQFLIRQHPPRLNEYRMRMRSRRSERIDERLDNVAESVDVMLGDMERREGLMDRRFYIVCEEDHIEGVLVAMERVQLKVGMLAGRALDLFVLSAIFGQSPADLPAQDLLRFKNESNSLSSDNGQWRHTIRVSRYPRTLDVSFLRSILTIGIALDVSLHIWPMESGEIMRKLQRQITAKKATAQSQIEKKGQVDSAERFAIDDLESLRDRVMRGEQRVFMSSWTITVHAESERKLRENVQTLRSMFASVLADVDMLPNVQSKAIRTTMPLANNALGRWLRTDTNTLALLFPFTPADLDTRTGPLVGIDPVARSLVTLDIFDSPGSQNMNMSITATSGAGKSFSAKLFVERYVTRGAIAYLIDPEGEYLGLAEAAGGRIITPGVPGQGLNPFRIEETGPEMTERVKHLVKLLQVMINERLNAEMVGRLDDALMSYYEEASARGEDTHWEGVYNYIKSKNESLGIMLSPFYTGTSKYLLADDGRDMLEEEAPITVFNLKNVDDDKKPAAQMVCSEAVWNRAERVPWDRLVLVDEAWMTLKNPDGAEFMMNTAKRARKHRMSLFCITQDLQDLLTENTTEGIKGNSGRAVIQNASNKLLLRQDAAAIETVMKTFNLNIETASELPGLPTGRGLLLTPLGQYFVDLEASPEEVELFKWEAGQGGVG